MERLIMGVCRVLAIAVVLYTMYCMWTSLLLLAVVIAAVLLGCRYVSSRLQVILPGEGRVVFITGCDTGIGHESAIAASQRGMTVVAGCLDDSSPGAKRLAETKGVHVVQLDVTKEATITAALSKVSQLCGDKGLWAVVNNAGFNRQAPVEMMSMETFQHVADVMLFGTVRVTKAFLPLVRRAKGRVLTMSSDRGMLCPALSAAYCIAKHGVEAFSDVLRAEMAQFGVTVSIIQPGHFGASTAIISSQSVNMLRTSMERDLKKCSEEVQKAYNGQQQVEDILDNAIASKESSAKDASPIVVAIMQAILSNQPANRYPVQGTTGRVDWGIVLGKIKPVVPDALLAWVQTIVMDK